MPIWIFADSSKQKSRSGLHRCWFVGWLYFSAYVQRLPFPTPWLTDRHRFNFWVTLKSSNPACQFLFYTNGPCILLRTPYLHSRPAGRQGSVDGGILYCRQAIAAEWASLWRPRRVMSRLMPHQYLMDEFSYRKTEAGLYSRQITHVFCLSLPNLVCFDAVGWVIWPVKTFTK